MKTILIFILTALNIYPGAEKAAPSIDSYTHQEKHYYPPFMHADDQWADSILQQMTVEEKIGQLFMVAAYSNQSEENYKYLEYEIKQYHLGGLIFFQGNPAKQIELTNRYQNAAKYPLMIGIDAEWGLGMRLDSTISYPRQLLLGAIQDDELIYEMGREIGRQHKRMGIHVNFAPVVDVNNNPNNPVINDRSFGENRENVSKKGIAYMNGLQKENIMDCAKHFPGHGDTDVDSHKDLPVILHDRQRLDSIELYPFRELTNNGVSSMMVAHLNIPALDSTLNSPSTVSRKIVTGLLKEELGFNGLIFTDALQMKGITKNLAVGESSVKAFMAGNDVLLFPDNVKAAVNQMKTAYSKGLYSEADLNKSVKKILMAKQWVGIQQFDSLQVENVVADLNTEEAKLIQTKLIEAAITVVRDSGNTIPIMALENKRIASITIGAKSATPFTKMLDNYENVDHFYLGKNEEWSQFERTLKVLERYDYVLANTLDMSRYASKQYGISTNTEKILGQLSKKDNAILTVFGSPYSLIKFPGWKELIVAYEASDEAQELAAQVIFGGRKASGKLPVSAGEYKFGEGKSTVEPIRLKYGDIRELGYSSSDFAKLDSIIEATLSIKATPGCQVLVAKDGQVIYERSFGRHTYDKNGISVKNSDLYDIASITKIVASTALVMKLVEDGKLDIDKTLGEYIDLPEGCNKKDLIIKEMLAHQSGLWPWIPFYLETLDSNKSIDPEVYQKSKSEDFPIIVCNDLYCSFVYQDSIWSQINNSELRPEKGYKYSDLGFYYMMLVIEKLYQRPIEDLVQELLYDPMGMNKTTYLPLEAGFKLREIVPTETEKIFRGRTIHGYVHDPGAAMMGGIGGHAGIFSNANDLAKFMQMLLNGGVYGGRKYLDSTTIKTFTSAPYEDSRRGIGFDKPDPDGRWGSACASASLASFGHTGFTGTMAFADPENDLIFVFLSNRIHPTADNKKLITESSRTQMHQAIYDIFEK